MIRLYSRFRCAMYSMAIVAFAMVRSTLLWADDDANLYSPLLEAWLQAHDAADRTQIRIELKGIP